MKSCFFKITFLFFTFIFSFFENYGQTYFQQDVNYTIRVRLDDSRHELHGKVIVEYKNNSPSTLDYIWFHLWPNGYKDNHTALATQLLENGDSKFYFSKEEQRGFIDSLYFLCDNKKAAWQYDSLHLDICKVNLNTPLASGASVVISTPFHVKLPEGIFSRLGHMGESYQITQWYPKPAVFDQFGWHQMPYLNQGEFYSEFGNYDVEITLPANYVVGATGDLQTSSEIKWLDDKAAATRAQLEMYSDNEKKDMRFPKSDSVMKTLKYTQQKVHDFAWFADKRYHVLKGEVELPVSHRKVTTWAMFTNNEKKYWKKSISYINDAVWYYSKWIGEYPYEQVTAVDGALSAGGGMEYPNVTVIGPTGSDYLLDEVILHEVGHNWFYGILGSNEREHAWMDEGINTFYEVRTMHAKYSSDTAGFPGMRFLSRLLDLQKADNSAILEAALRSKARFHLDQPIDIHSSDFTELNYGGVVYMKTAIVLEGLRSHLGDSIFDLCMQQYFSKWKFKHPYPDNLRDVFESTTGKNLDWIFDDLIKTNKILDYKIKSLRRSKTDTLGYSIKIKNKGKVKSPFVLGFIKNDSLISQIHVEGFEGLKEMSVPDIGADQIVLDPEKKLFDLNPKNNSIYTTGILKKMEPFRFRFLMGLENPKKTQLYFTPIAGWNRYDQGLAGIAFYNAVMPSRKFEYVLAPMYGTGSKTISGMANAGFTFYPNSQLYHHVRISCAYRKFSEEYWPINLSYQKIAPEIYLQMRKPFARSPFSHYLRFRYVYLQQEIPLYSPTDNRYSRRHQEVNVNELTYHVENTRPINSYQCDVYLQNGDGFTKTWIDARYHLTLYKNRAIGVRLMSGKFLSNNFKNDFAFSLFGNHDDLYDMHFLGRSETQGWLSQQTGVNDGGFKNNYAAPAADDWITTINLEVPFPWKMPFKVYGDGGVTNASTQFEYDAGIAFVPWRGIVEFYFPLVMARDLNQGKYQEHIRFTFNIHLLNPFTIIKNSF